MRVMPFRNICQREIEIASTEVVEDIAFLERTDLSPQKRATIIRHAAFHATQAAHYGRRLQTMEQFSAEANQALAECQTRIQEVSIG